MFTRDGHPDLVEGIAQRQVLEAIKQLSSPAYITSILSYIRVGNVCHNLPILGDEGYIQGVIDLLEEGGGISRLDQLVDGYPTYKLNESALEFLEETSSSILDGI